MLVRAVHRNTPHVDGPPNLVRPMGALERRLQVLPSLRFDARLPAWRKLLHRGEVRRHSRRSIVAVQDARVIKSMDGG